MPRLTDKTLLQQLDIALRDRSCSVSWEEEALQELQGMGKLTAEAVNDALAREFIDRRVAPDIEVQKGGPYDGQQRYVWRIKVAGVPLYIKTRVFLDHHQEPCLEIVRCHRGHY